MECCTNANRKKMNHDFWHVIQTHLSWTSKQTTRIEAWKHVQPNELMGIFLRLVEQKGTLGALGFCIFCFFHVFSLFSFPPFHMSKKSMKTKKKQKNNPVRRIWSKSIPDCFFLFFGFHGFSRGFLVSQAPTVQKLEENQKSQKNQSCEKNLG